MGSAGRKFGTQEERRSLAQAALVDATIALIAERGLLGFSLSDIGERAGVGRALAGYHFGSRGALLQAATSSLLDNSPEPHELGLGPLQKWMQSQTRRAAQGDHRLLALLQVAVGPGADPGFLELRREYWRRQTALVQRHLAAARVVGQLRDELDPLAAAPVIVGQLHGEILRIVATGQPPTPAFLDLLEDALAPGAEAAKAGGKPRAGKRAEEAQPGLFT